MCVWGGGGVVVCHVGWVGGWVGYMYVHVCVLRVYVVEE